MHILQNMDMNQFIIIAPTALIVMYILINLQKSLCEKKNPYKGLIIPAVCFIAATILAVRPLVLLSGTETDGLILITLRMWVTFNVVTVIFLIPYFKQLGNRKAQRAAEAAASSTPEEEKTE